MFTGNQQILVITIETKDNYILSECRSREFLEHDEEHGLSIIIVE